MATLLIISIGIPVFTALCFLWYFRRRIKVDDREYNQPLNSSLKQIHKNNFRKEGYLPPPERNFVVIPKSGVKRRAYNMGSFILESIPNLPKKFSNFETIVVDDVNDSSKIKKSIIERIRLETIPFDIIKNLPTKWREYITWKLLLQDHPKGYGHTLVEIEKSLDLTSDEKKVFEIITDPKKMFEYLDSTYLEETRTEFDFLRVCVYKMCRIGVPSHEFDWIFNEISNKNLLIVQVLSSFKKSTYTNLIINNKSILSYNVLDIAYQILHDIKDDLNQNKIVHRFHSNANIPFATILKG